MSRVNNNIKVIYAKVNEFRSNDEYCDINIHVDEKVFRCHRLILAATSEYFHATFSGNYKESNEKDISLSNLIDASAFEEVLRFAYTGDVVITPENVCSLLVASDYLQLLSVEENCIEYIKQNNVPIQNALDLFVYAHSTNKNSLVDFLVEYIKVNFDSISKTNTFLEFPSDALLALFRLFLSSLSIRNEDTLLDAIIKWVFYASEERRKYFRELVHHINFICSDYFNSFSKTATFLELSFDELRLLLDHCENYPSWYEDMLLDAVIRWIHHAHGERNTYYCKLVESINFQNISPSYLKFAMKKYVASNTAVDSFESADYPSRKPSTLHVFIGVKNSAYVFSMKENANNWNLTCSIPSGIINSPYINIKCNHRSVRLDNNLYNLTSHIGTNWNERKFFAASSVDLSTDFQVLASPPKFSTFQLCNLRNLIYLYVSEHPQCIDYEYTFYAYDAEIDTWFPTCPLKTEVDNACVTADGNRVYVVGGQYSSGGIKYGCFQAYDSRTSQWLELPRSDNTFVDAACCVHEGKIYVSGGTCEKDKTEIFDPVAGKWQRGTPMNRKRYSHQLLSYQNRLWAIGDDSAGLSIDAYDTVLQKWSIVVALDEALETYLPSLVKNAKLIHPRWGARPVVKDAVLF